MASCISLLDQLFNTHTLFHIRWKIWPLPTLTVDLLQTHSILQRSIPFRHVCRSVRNRLWSKSVNAETSDIQVSFYQIVFLNCFESSWMSTFVCTTFFLKKKVKHETIAAPQVKTQYEILPIFRFLHVKIL